MARIRGTIASETINGTALADGIYGLDGNDTLNGGAGNDPMDGGNGNDTLNGGGDNDRLYGGKGNDTLVGGTGNDVLYGSTDVDSLSGGDGNDILDAGTGNDTLNGGLGDDRLVGGVGNDVMNGDDGNDVIVAGSGSDTINGGNQTASFNAATTGIVGGDTLSYDDATAAVVLTLSAGLGGTGGALGDTWASMENLTGSRYADTLTAAATVSGLISGGAGNDTINSGGGVAASMLRGDAGYDTLNGSGSTIDWFVAQYDMGMDRFESFDVLADFVFASKAEFKLSGATAGSTLNASALEVGTSHLATTATTRFVFETDTHILWADLDGNGTAYQSTAIAVINAANTFDATWITVLA